VNYKEEIKRLLKRIPQKVINGSTNQAIGYKIVVEKAMAVSCKARASEAELMRALADLQAYE
jgi:hypothetical protein